ncbi:hypothetical protein JAAARDRAFT_196879 [Jaapia argillacea MUCL 33604]|uniref:DNA2/NAM7 helicase-like C-terminal domain-containing protein n=1 Tax=Jaapia argillacea MUCL 33604 TaxID=933084 RepID=A0A067PGS8_9AGAM|nr:hypothetical protein JAAARDRAFT_196879 [Jaapia argillacea MUCL 33604]
MNASGKSAKNVAKCTEAQDDPSPSSPGSDESESSHDEAMDDDEEVEDTAIAKPLQSNSDLKKKLSPFPRLLELAGRSKPLYSAGWRRRSSALCSVSPHDHVFVEVVLPFFCRVPTLLQPLHGRELEIGIVDGMQGRETEAIVIRPVRSNEQREVGFLKDQRRLNGHHYDPSQEIPPSYAECSFHPLLGLTYQQYIVGDSSTLKHGSSFLKEWLNWLAYNADIRYTGLDGGLVFYTSAMEEIQKCSGEIPE